MNSMDRTRNGGWLRLRSLDMCIGERVDIFGKMMVNEDDEDGASMQEEKRTTTEEVHECGDRGGC